MPEKTDSIADIQMNLDNIEALCNQRGFQAICGVDEAGRGPLAGPVVAAAVIIPEGVVIEGIDDSKKLSATRRVAVFDEIVKRGLPCAVGIIDHETIDQINIHQASLLAMRKAVMDCTQAPDLVLVDGKFTIPRLTQPQYAVVGGDGRCQSIAAASIIAKVTRDRIMDHYQAIFPSFSFATHKGYPTAKHIAELDHHGPCDIHRRSFRPVAERIVVYETA